MHNFTYSIKFSYLIDNLIIYFYLSDFLELSKVSNFLKNIFGDEFISENSNHIYYLPYDKEFNEITIFYDIEVNYKELHNINKITYIF